MRENNRNKGFTFIELILYMAILGIFMVAVMSLISSTVASHKNNRPDRNFSRRRQRHTMQ